MHRRLLSGCTICRRPGGFRPGAGCPEVHRPGGHGQHDAQRDHRSDQSVSRRLRRLEAIHRYLAHLVVGRRLRRPRRGAAADPLGLQFAPSMERRESRGSGRLGRFNIPCRGGGFREAIHSRIQALPAGVSDFPVAHLGGLSLWSARSGDGNLPGGGDGGLGHFARARPVRPGIPKRVSAFAAIVHGRDERDDDGYGRPGLGAPKSPRTIGTTGGERPGDRPRQLPTPDGSAELGNLEVQADGRAQSAADAGPRRAEEDQRPPRPFDRNKSALPRRRCHPRNLPRY